MSEPSTLITLRDAADLNWYLGQVVFHRSTLGPQLERAAVMSVGSDGRRHRAESLWERDAHGVVVGQRQRVYCRETRTSDGGYEPDHADMVRYARVSTRLNAVARLSESAYVALGLYYGNAGNRWGNYWAEKARGPGALMALFELTAAGRKRLGDLASKRKADGQPESLLQPAEQLASDWVAQDLQPTGERRLWHRRILDQAELLLGDAHRTWNQAGALERAQVGANRAEER